MASIQDMIVSEATAQGVDPQLALSVAQAESDFNPNARSPVGAMGVFQLMPATAAGLGVVDPFDAAQNIAGGVRYLSQMLSMWGGDAQKALASYNWGPGNVQKAVTLYGDSWIDHLPAETANYLNKILGAGADAVFGMTVFSTALMPDWMWILLGLGSLYLVVNR